MAKPILPVAQFLQIQLRDDFGIKSFTEVEIAETGRKWRWDLVVADNILIEVQGGTWSRRTRFSHSTGTAMKRDRAKRNAAQILGYVALDYSPDEVFDGTACKEIMSLLNRRAGSRP